MYSFIITYWMQVSLFALASIPSIVLFTIKGRISHWFKKDLKKFEGKLELLKMQEQLQYSNIYAKRAESIRDLYFSICDLNYTLAHFADGCSDSEDYYYILNSKLETELKNQIDKIVKLSSLYRLYFSNSTNDKIKNYSKKLQLEYYTYVAACSEEYHSNNFFNEFESFINRLKGDDFVILADQLVDEFRDLIGVRK